MPFANQGRIPSRSTPAELSDLSFSRGGESASVEISAAATLLPGWPRSFPGFVPKRNKTLTFSATFGRDVNQMQTITVITILALLTISGAVISDRVLTGQGQPVVVHF
jgi:hypothetical protein